MTSRVKGTLAATAAMLALGLGPTTASAAGAQASGHWSLVAGQHKAVKFKVSFKANTTGFTIKLPLSANLKATSVSAPGFSCHVTFFLLIQCTGSLAANHTATGVVHLNKNAHHRIGGHLHGFTGGAGLDGTMKGP